jgi:hypothetical protein
MGLKLLAAFVFTIVVNTASAVPVVPNASLIKGMVLESEAISSTVLGMQSEKTICKLTIQIESSDDVGEMRNFLKGKEGKDMVFYTKEPLPSQMVKKRINARVSYRGDEREGLWWAHEIEILD